MATMALVREVMAASTARGSMLPVPWSTSTNTGRAPRWSAALAVAAKVKGEVTPSSPGPTPIAAYATCSAAVPELTATALRAPVTLLRSASKASTRGPVVMKSDLSTSTTAATSSSSIDCRPYGMGLSDIRHLLQLLDGEPPGVGVAAISEAFRDGFRMSPGCVIPPACVRLDDEVAARIDRPAGGGRAAHLLVGLLPGSNPADFQE